MPVLAIFACIFSSDTSRLRRSFSKRSASSFSRAARIFASAASLTFERSGNATVVPELHGTSPYETFPLLSHLYNASAGAEVSASAIKHADLNMSRVSHKITGLFQDSSDSEDQALV